MVVHLKVLQLISIHCFLCLQTPRNACFTFSSSGNLFKIHNNVWPPDGKRKYLLYLTTWAPIVISKGFGSISCNRRPQTFGFQMVSVSKFTGSGYIIHGAILIICVFIGIIRIGAHLGDLATVFSL